MNLLYQFFVQILSFLFWFASFFSSKAKKGIEGRKNQKNIFKNYKNEKFIWMHCSSVGEFEQGRPVLEAIKKLYPDKKIALSFFSPSGYELRKDYESADVVFYLPIDTKKNINDLLKNFNPEILILVKYDYWFNLLKSLKNKNIPVVVVSAIFRKNQYKLNWIEKNYFKILKDTVSHFFVQNNDSALILKSHNISNFTIAGDTRYDRVSQIANQNIRLPWLENFKGNNKLIVLGSTWASDEKIVINTIKEYLPKDWKAVFVPHEINENTIPHFQKELGKNISFYTKGIDNNSKFLIVNTVGFLSKIYAYAEIAYVGGGFNKSGVHNTLEPAVFGIPIIIGSNNKKFQEVQDLIQAKVVFSISDEESFSRVLSQIIHSDRELYKTNANIVFEKNIGVTYRILNFLKNKQWL